MNRREFTLAIAKQVVYMEQKLGPFGFWPVLDWVKRSLYDQRNEFGKGTSKCDGTVKVSQHQRGLAADVLVLGVFCGKAQIIDPRLHILPPVWKDIRDHWVGLGGKPMLEWDQFHFEG